MLDAQQQELATFGVAVAENTIETQPGQGLDANDAADRSRIQSPVPAATVSEAAVVPENVIPDTATSSGGQNDKMKDIMSFLDAVEAQVIKLSDIHQATCLL